MILVTRTVSWISFFHLLVQNLFPFLTIESLFAFLHKKNSRLAKSMELKIPKSLKIKKETKFQLIQDNRYRRKLFSRSSKLK